MDSWATADQVWAGGLIFARVAAILMLIPGFGEAFRAASWGQVGAAAWCSRASGAMCAPRAARPQT